MNLLIVTNCYLLRATGQVCKHVNIPVSIVIVLLCYLCQFFHTRPVLYIADQQPLTWIPKVDGQTSTGTGFRIRNCSIFRKGIMA